MFLNFLIIHNLAYNGFSFEIVSQFCTTIKVEKTHNYDILTFAKNIF